MTDRFTPSKSSLEFLTEHEISAMKKAKKYVTALALYDEHIPYLSEEMVRVAEQYLQDEKPKYRIHGGDIFDNPGMSVFDPDPNHKRDTQDEIDETVRYLHRLYQASPKTEVVILAGNHDVARLERLKRTTPFALKNLRALDYPHLIMESAAHQDLDIGNPIFAYEWELGPGMLFTHGDPRMDPRIKGGVTGPRRTAETHPYQGHVVMGHKHKAQIATGPWGDRKVVQVAAMIDLNHKAYMHHSDYENGMLVVKYNPNVRPKPVYHIQNAVAAPNGDILLDGKMYNGRGR